MKVTCQSCQAKYSIADEKVRGKIAKIRCKKCGTTIMVDGTAVDGDSATAASAGTDAQANAAVVEQAAIDDGSWTVLVADEDQRTVSASQIVEMYTSGLITLETHVWKDGMQDWLPIEQVEALRSMLHGGQAEVAAAPAHSPAVDESAKAAVKEAAPHSVARPAAAVAASKATQPAARTEPRKPGRGGSADLFGGAAGADDVLTSAPPQGGAAVADKPTGARNENSVLFSLSALTGSKPPPSRDEPSGTADLRALAGAPGNGVSGKSKFDEIMNLGAGGIYAGTLASPALAPPPVDEPVNLPDTSLPAPAKAKTKAGFWFAVASGLIGVTGIAVALASQLGGSDQPTTGAGGSGVTTTLSGNTAPTSVAPPSEVPSAPREPAAPTAIVPGAAAKPDSEKDTKPPTTGATKPQPGGGTASKSEETTKKPANNLQAIGQAIANEKPAAPPPPAAAPAPPPGASFDRAAAISALSAIASAVQACKRADGPTGTGRVSITFAPSGNATTANVEGPPFAGTPVGGCVAARFRTARVPPFSGDTVTVHKTFSIN